MGTLPNNGSALTLNFAAKTVTSLRLTVNSVSATTSSVGLAELQAFATVPPVLPPSPRPRSATRPAGRLLGRPGRFRRYHAVHLLARLGQPRPPASASTQRAARSAARRPTLAGTYSFTAKVTDAASRTATRALQIVLTEPLQITTASLPSGQTGQAYSQSVTASGGSAPYAWSVSVGTLPPGLSLTQGSPSATLSGTPTSGGSYSFTLRAADSGNPARSASQAFSLTILAPLSLTTTSLRDGTRGVAYSDSLARPAVPRRTASRSPRAACPPASASASTPRAVRSPARRPTLPAPTPSPPG